MAQCLCVMDIEPAVPDRTNNLLGLCFDLVVVYIYSCKQWISPKSLVLDLPSPSLLQDMIPGFVRPLGGQHTANSEVRMSRLIVGL
jgi:hypothetical protein